jgi:glycosyltransferase involved in cell wall biosynthesis
MGKKDLCMEKLIKKIFRKFGLEITRCIPDIYENEFITVKPEKACQGYVLLAYIIEPFLLKPGEPVLNTHTNYGESLEIAKTFLELGYGVDVISYRNSKFVPKKKYSFFVAARTNFERIARLLNEDCVKIVHLDTAHWLFNNFASYKRSLTLQGRKGVTIRNQRIVESNLAIEYADYATILGNQFTVSTYRYAQKPMFCVPVPTCVVYPWAEHKNYENCRRKFLWFGSGGLVHKGLDLVLDVFAEMPDYHLTICGPIQKEKDFVNSYYKELYQTTNIHTFGWIDVSRPEFIEIANNCIGIIYPSCSEGQAGAVVTCMQAGLIPIVSYESGVDVNDFGVILKDCSLDEVRSSMQMISSLPAQKLEAMSRKAWEYARTNHTRDKFAEEFKNSIVHIIKNKTGLGNSKESVK